MISRLNGLGLFGIAIALMLLAPAASRCQLMNTGRTIGFAGADGTDMIGALAPGWNPANLAASDAPFASICIGSFGLAAGNNSFSYPYVSRMFHDGRWITDSDKEDILHHVGPYGLLGYGLGSVSLYGMSYDGYGMNMDVQGVGTVTIPRDIVELGLYGPAPGKHYRFDDLEADAGAWGSFGFSAASLFPPPPFLDRFALGFNLRLLMGLNYQGLIVHDGEVYTSQREMRIKANLQRAESHKGDGMALDIGARGENRTLRMKYGVTIGNLLGKMYWHRVTITHYEADFPAALSIKLLQEGGYVDQFLKQYIDPDLTEVPQALPRYILFNASREYPEKLMTVYASYYQSFNGVAGQSLIPRIAGGVEWRRYLLPLRGGISLGGQERLGLSVGTGYQAEHYRFDIGMGVQITALGLPTGYSFGITNYIEMPPAPTLWEELKELIRKKHVNQWE